MGIFDRFRGPAESSKTGGGMVDSVNQDEQDGVSGNGNITFFEPKHSSAVEKEEIVGLGGLPLGSEALMKASLQAAHMSEKKSASIAVPAAPVIFDFKSGKPRGESMKVEVRDEPGEILIPAGESVPNESEAFDFNLKIGQVWKTADAAFRVAEISADAQSVEIVFTEGVSAGEQKTLPVSELSALIDEQGFANIPEEVSEEIIRRALKLVEQRERQSNPLVQPAFDLIDKAHLLAAERGDEKMLAYLRDAGAILDGLVDKSKLDSADISVIGEVHKKLDVYLEDVVGKTGEAQRPSGKEDSVQEKPLKEERMAKRREGKFEAFKNAVEEIRQEVLQKIDGAKTLSQLMRIGEKTKRSGEATSYFVRVFFDDTEPRISDTAGKVSHEAIAEAKKHLNDINRELERAWQRRRRELEVGDAEKELSMRVKTSSKNGLEDEVGAKKPKIKKDHLRGLKRNQGSIDDNAAPARSNRESVDLAVELVDKEPVVAEVAVPEKAADKQAQQEIAQGELIELSGVIKDKKKWAEEYFADPVNADKVTQAQYDNLTAYLDKLEKDAEDALSDGRYKRMRYILDDARAAEFKPEKNGETLKKKEQKGAEQAAPVERTYEVMEKTLSKIMKKQCMSVVTEGLAPFVAYASDNGVALKDLIESMGIDTVAEGVVPAVMNILESSKDLDDGERHRFALEFAKKEIAESLE
jgi:hypothetical protein